MAKGKEKDVLYRAVKFEIFPDEDQIAILRKVSDNLWQVWNEGLEERQKLFDEHIAPFYEALKNLDNGGEALAFSFLQTKDPALLSPELARKLLEEGLKEIYKEHQITLFDQINALTPKRHSDESFAKIPRNWQEETLDTLDAAFKSFVALRKNADPQARPPRMRSEWNFCEIPGRSGFLVKDGKIALAPNSFGKGVLAWPIPEEYQGIMLARAVRVKKFTLYRDEHDMREKGRFWISLAYEIQKPPTRPFEAEKAVYVALGASFIGIVSPKGEEIIPLWRSDKHWMPEIKAVEERIEHPSSGTNVHALTKGSRVWRKRHGARREMFRIMGAQQKQDRREIVILEMLEPLDPLEQLEQIGDKQLLSGHGVHFIVSDLVVRSKKGKLADSSKPERGGALGLNWSAQNTGSIAYLVQWLGEKVKEYGGTVRKHRLPIDLIVPGVGHENKIPMAQALRDDFLRSFKKAA